MTTSTNQDIGLPAFADEVHGKTIDSVSGTDDHVVIDFTDGTSFVLESWDYEGYSSGIYFHRIEEAA